MKYKWNKCIYKNSLIKHIENILIYNLRLAASKVKGGHWSVNIVKQKRVYNEDIKFQVDECSTSQFVKPNHQHE